MSTTRVIMSSPWRTKLASKFGGSDKPDMEHENELGMSESVQKIARKELREDKSARDQCTQQMREWLKKTDDVENVRTDDAFLLRFLRAKKFSVPMAQQLLLKYLNLRKVFPDMAANLDFLGEPMNRVFSKGYLVVSPIRDEFGRRVLIATAGNFDPYTFSSAAQAKAHFIALETLLDDPQNQVVGFTHVCDMSGVIAAHVTNWKPSDFSRSLRWGEQSWPARHKAVHAVHLPSSVRFVMDFARAKLSPKMKDRFLIHSNINEMHKHIDTACLPKELGGTIPLAEMNEWWLRELASKREKLIALDKMILHSDKNIITSKREKSSGNKTALQAHVDSVAGSFRKLEVD